MLRATECLRAYHFGLRPIADRTLSLFPGVRTVVTSSVGFIFVAEDVVQNFCTNFMTVLRPRTVPCLQGLKWRLNIRCVDLIELFRTNVSTLNARCTNDHWSVFTKWHP
jgi:hypothetical protein